MNPKIGTKFLRGHPHTSEQRLHRLQKSLTKLEQRQEAGFNKNRQHAINRLWEQLAMVAVEDGARPAGDEVMCVEVKPEGQDLSTYQKLVMQKLTRSNTNSRANRASLQTSP